MHIEVLICTHNRVDLLQKVLQSINSASRTEKCKLSVLVIANACTDQTHSFLEKYQVLQKKNNKLALKWQKEPKPGKSFALNRAISQLEGDLIAFVDDDHRVSQKYFITLYHAYKNFPDNTIFFGKILPDWSGDEPSWAHDTGKYAIYPLPVPHYDKGDKGFDFHNNIAIPGGGNLVLKKEVFDNIGFFNTELGPQGHDLGGGEDGDYVIRAIKKKEKLRYLPDMIQYHYVDLERFHLTYIMKKSFQRSRSAVLIKIIKNSKIPNYLWKKLLIYISKVFFSLSLKKTRFYLVRVAATLGEINAYKSGR